MKPQRLLVANGELNTLIIKRTVASLRNIHTAQRLFIITGKGKNEIGNEILQQFVHHLDGSLIWLDAVAKAKHHFGHYPHYTLFQHPTIVFEANVLQRVQWIVFLISLVTHQGISIRRRKGYWISVHRFFLPSLRVLPRKKWTLQNQLCFWSRTKHVLSHWILLLSLFILHERRDRGWTFSRKVGFELPEMSQLPVLGRGWI